MIENVYPLSPLQEGLYYHWLKDTESLSYFIQLSYQLRGKMDLDAVRISCQKLVEGHAVLRTFFSRDVGESLLQIVRQEPAPILTIVDAFGKDQAYIDEFRAEDRRKNFDLNRGPLMRLTVLRLGDERHEFIWSHHHILMDGWSVSMLIGEFFNIYNSLVKRQTPDLKKISPYSKYIEWLMKIDKDKTLQYWRTYLEGYDTISTIAGTAKRTGADRLVGVYKIRLQEKLSHSLRSLCVAMGTTMSSFLRTAWGILLSIYNDTDDVVFGSVVSGRPAELQGIEDMVGLFSNTVPVRIRPREGMTIAGLLKEVQQDAIDGISHHYVQLADVQAESELGRNLFDHILNFQNFPVQQTIRQGMEMTEGQAPLSLLSSEEYIDTEYDLVLTIDGGEVPEMRFDYNGQVYEKEDFIRLSGRLNHILHQMVKNPDSPVSEIEVLDERERQQVLLSFNGTAIDYDDQRAVLELFRDQVEKRPDDVAVQCGEQTLRYLDLDERSNQLANFLKDKYGACAGDPVGIIMDRSEKMILAILAVLKCGCAYVPIDPQNPPARKQFMLEEAGVNILLTELRYMSDLVLYTGYSFVVDAELDQIGTSGTFAGDPIDDGRPAYIIYTSGSTGNPKGCIVTHRNLNNYVKWANRYYFPGGEKVNFPLFTSLSFDLTVTSVFCTLTQGGTLFVYEQDREISEVLLDIFNSKKPINSVKLTPAHINILDHLDIGPTGVSTVIAGGEELTANHIAILKKIDQQIKVYNEYGPTEATVGCMAKLVEVGSPVLIGRPIANARIYVLDRLGRPSPIGICGEIHIGGAGVASGYINNSELTQERFLPDPFGSSGKIYKTGDLGRWMPEGEAEFAGRKDDQVKVRGYRVELGEIMDILLRHPSVKEATVLAKKDEEGNKMLVAYYVPSSGEKDSGEIRNYLFAQLPPYMVPTYFITVDKLPLTINGKIDKKRLPAPTVTVSGRDIPKKEADGEIERALIAVFEEVLKRKPVGITDNFFELGGDSIKSIQIGSRLKQRGYNLSIQDIIAYPVIEMLVPRVKKISRTISQEEVKGNIPLGPVQRAFFESSSIERQYYNISVLLEGLGPISEQGLRIAFDKILLDHDALRMVFHAGPQGFTQENRGRDQTYSLDIVEVDDEGQFVGECERIQASFDLENGPLVRAGLFRNRKGGPDRLLWVIHHLVCDGVSWRILLEDFTSLYKKHLSGELLTLPLKTDSFSFWQKKLQEYSRSKELENEAPYWERVGAAEVNPLPIDIQGGSNCVRDVSVQSIELNEDLTELLMTKCYRTYRTEINDILLAGLVLALGEVFHVSEAAIKLEGHGREKIGADVDISRTVGWFTAVYPVVFPVHKEDLIRQVSEVKDYLRQVPNKGIGYGILRYIAGKDYKMNPEVSFNYLGQMDMDPGSGEEGGETYFKLSRDQHGKDFSNERRRDTLLDVSGLAMSGKLHLNIAYSAGLHRASTIEGLLSAWQLSLKRLILLLSSGGADGTESNGRQMLHEAAYNQLFYFLKWDLPSDNVVSGYPHPHLNIPAFRTAVRGLIGRHEILRTIFVRVDDKIFQRVVPVEEFQLEISDPDGITRDKDLGVIVDREKFLKFKLFNSPLLRVGLYQIESGGHYILFNMHHTISDGYSAGVLQTDLMRLYHDILNKTETNLPALPFQYKDFSAWQKAFLDSADGIRHREYWLGKLKGFDPIMRFGHSTAIQRENNSLSIRSTTLIEADLLAKVDAFVRENGLTRPAFLMGTLVLLLSRLCNNEDITLATAVSGRNSSYFGDLDVTDLIGCFASALFVRNRIDGEMPALEFLLTTQNNFLEDLSFGLYPLARLLDEMPEIRPTAFFINSIVFYNYHNYGYFKETMYESFRANEQEVEGTVQLKCNFGLYIKEFKNCLELVFMFNPGLFDIQMRSRIKNLYFTILRQFLHDPAMRVKEVTKAVPEEKLSL